MIFFLKSLLFCILYFYIFFSLQVQKFGKVFVASSGHQRLQTFGLTPPPDMACCRCLCRAAHVPCIYNILLKLSYFVQSAKQCIAVKINCKSLLSHIRSTAAVNCCGVFHNSFRSCVHTTPEKEALTISILATVTYIESQSQKPLRAAVYWN